MAACGQSSTSPTDSDPSASTTSVTIKVRTAEGAEPRTMTLACDPAGGDHPQAEQACEALAATGPEVFEPLPRGKACTMIYGGPQTARVTGVVDGKAVDASFNRTNGCEIDRWERLGTTFFDVPLQ